MRGINNTLSLACGYAAVECIPLSEMVTILQFRPFLVVALCYIVLRESFSGTQVLACSEERLHSAIGTEKLTRTEKSRLVRSGVVGGTAGIPLRADHRGGTR